MGIHVPTPQATHLVHACACGVLAHGCGVGTWIPLRVCASRTHEFPAKTLRTHTHRGVSMFPRHSHGPVRHMHMHAQCEWPVAWEHRYPSVCVRPGRTNFQPRRCAHIHVTVWHLSQRVSYTLSTVDDLVRFVQHMTIDNIVVVEIGHTDSLDITHAVWRQTCGVGMHTPLRVCASRTHEFPAKTLRTHQQHLTTCALCAIHVNSHHCGLTTIFLDITHAHMRPTSIPVCGVRYVA